MLRNRLRTAQNRPNGNNFPNKPNLHGCARQALCWGPVGIWLAAKQTRRIFPAGRSALAMWQSPAARPAGTLGGCHMTYGDSARAAASRLAEETRKAAYAERHPSLSRDGEAGFFDAYVPEACPWCGSLRFRRDGHGRSGVQRCRCLGCRRTFTPATGTIFDSGHLPVSEWAMFLPKIPGSESEAACARDRQRSSETPPCWTAELFGVLAGRQDGTVPADGIWPDETCWPVDPKDRRRNADGSAMRGLSRNKACIGIAVDIHGASLCLDEGPGKTSRKRTRDAFRLEYRFALTGSF